MLSGIWNRQIASICHCGAPYQTASDPNTIGASPKNFNAWPRMCAQTDGNVMTDEANVVPNSAYTFGNLAESTRNRVVQRMSGTPMRVLPDCTSSRALRTQQP